MNGWILHAFNSRQFLLHACFVIVATMTVCDGSSVFAQHDAVAEPPSFSDHRDGEPTRIASRPGVDQTDVTWADAPQQAAILDPADGGRISSGLSVEQVMELAATNSPNAKLLEAERRALGCGLDCDDPAMRAQVGLLQAVLRELAEHERDNDACSAEQIFYQMVGLNRQRTLLQDATTELDALINLSQRAEDLDLDAIDVPALQRQRLAIDNQLQKLNYGFQKLQIPMSRHLGIPLDLQNPPLLNDQL
ncbi:MAG: hypothetical protein AAFP90_07470, partial [Planctomycetota bacterium]